MAETSTNPSSTENTDHEETFEDAQGSASHSSADTVDPLEKPQANAHKTENETEDATEVEEHEPVSPTLKQLSPPRIVHSRSQSQTSTSAIHDAASEKSVEAATEAGDATPKAAASKSSRFGVPWGTAAAARRPSSNYRDPSPQPTSQAAPPRRGTVFAWFTSRAATPGSAKVPPVPPKLNADARRNTHSSISTLGSNPELMLKALDDSSDGRSKDGGSTRNSLKEKFKLLRMQEETGIILQDSDKAETHSTSGEDGVDAATDQMPASPTYAPSIAPSIASSVNPDLPPGTVSGFSTGPTDGTPIDWDFWQTVVNEGPQAVARSSPEELTAAIAGGIPQTIRGVIWQVLAGSKNDDLEAVYQEFKVKGTKDELQTSRAPSVASVHMNGNPRELDSVSSSKSSIHSNQSTPATSANIGEASPTPSTEMGDPISRASSYATKTDPAAIAKLEKMIKRDMGSRTSYSKYAAAAGYQEGLFNVCRAYALFDEAVGYPQGMNFIIMPMLFNMSEEEAFCLLTRLMHKYKLRDLFVDDMPGLHRNLYQFERLLEDLEPALYCHLNRRAVTPKLYATQWFLTLFAYRLPLQLVMRVFDLVLCEGLEGAILKFGVALVQRNVETLLAIDDMQALTTYLKEKLFDAYIDSAPSSKSILESGFFGNSGGTDTDVYRADLLVQDACAVKLTPDMLARYTTEWEEKVRVDKARETELENLRTDSTTKASQIRSLEQRAEKSDAEFIQMSNELVKLKVENSDLQDHNESLRGQVEELKKVAESEAKNTEERLRAGTEQVMQRNIEVQNENRHMEEQMADMERELVQMKLKFAELHTDHEGLKQRWADLKRAIE